MRGHGDAPPLNARLASQLLAGEPARSVEHVVGRLLAVQAQDPRGFRLAVRCRSTGLTATDVDRALTEARSVVVSWLNRGTLHLVRAEDYWWLHALTTPQVRTTNERRLRQEGVSPAQADRGVEVVVEALAADGPQTRAQLRERLAEAGVPTAQQAAVHVLFAASLRAHVVRGPMVGNEQAFVRAEDWLGPAPPAVDRDEALARLGRRYLAGHAPAEPRDLARWAGITLGDARLALADADAEAEVVTPVVVPAPPRLLGPFDPLLLGWASRDWVVGPHGHVVTSNGVFRPVALLDGRVVATWSLARGEVALHPLEPFDPAAFDDEAADVRRFA